jgi:hypothetical protein
MERSFNKLGSSRSPLKSRPIMKASDDFTYFNTPKTNNARGYGSQFLNKTPISQRSFRNVSIRKSSAKKQVKELKPTRVRCCNGSRSIRASDIKEISSRKKSSTLR